MAFGFFDPQKGQSATGIAQSRAMAAALLRSGGAPKNVGEGLNSIGDAIFYRSLIGDADASEKAGTDAFTSQFNSLIAPYSGGQAASIPMPTAAGEVAATAPGAVSNTGVLPGSLLAALDKTEGGGGYDTLFGNAQRKGPFAGTDVSKMSIADVLAFQDPNGPYAQTVKGQVGRVATPVGRHQIVGTTLRNAVGALGLDPSQPFDPATQDQVALYLAKNRIKASDNLAGQMAGLRSEWEGFRNIPDAQLAQIIGDLKGGVQTAPVGNVEVASLAAPQTATDAINTASPQPGYRDPQVTTAYANPAPTTAAPPLPAPTTVAAAPAVAEAAPLAAPQQVAQNFQPQQIDPRLIEAANSPFATPGQKAILGGIIQQQQQRNQLIMKQQMEQADPATQIELETKKIQLQNLRNKTSEDTFTNVGDGYLFNNRTKEFIRAPQNAAVGGNLFQGNALDAQALNKLVENGSITQDQALNIAAGKVAPDPTTGALTFFPASALVGGGAQAQQQQPYVDLFGNGGEAPQQPAQTPQGGNGSVPLTGNRAPTEGQANAAGFTDRMASANDVINRLEASGTDKEQALKSSIPLIGNYLTDENFQSYDRAKRDFINAQLRRESGAAIGKDEYTSADKQYFPQPGDSAQVLKDKAQARALAIQGMTRSAGPSYNAPKQEAVSDDIRAARDAIKAGAPRDKVIERLQAAGIDTTGL